MSKYIGREITVGIGRETTRGSPIAATYWLPCRTIDFEDKVSILVDNQNIGRIEDSYDAKTASKWAEGGITGVVGSKAIGLLLYNAFGTSSPCTASPTAGVTTHVLSVAQTHQHNSITIEFDDAVQASPMAFALAMMNKLEISAELNEFVLFTADFLSKKGVATPTTAAYAIEPNFMCKDVGIEIADQLSQLAGATPKAVKVKSATLTIEKEIEKDDILGNENPDDFLNKSFSISVVVTRNYEDTNIRDVFLSASPQAFRFEMITDDGTGTPIVLTVDLNQVKITEYATTKGLDDIMSETFTAKANYKIADSRMVEARLQNTVATY